MSLKPSISLKLGQQLRMTPQLQQAIRLLQLSSIDLEMEIQEALDSNFMLEEVDPESDSSSEETSLDQPDAATEDASDNTNTSSSDDSTSDDEPRLDPEIDGEQVTDSRDEVDAESIAVDLPVDTSWEDALIAAL